MKKNRQVNIIHIGPQKSATTWVYKALLEHPDILCANSDRVHYFDMRYHKGKEWYANQFPNEEKAGQKVFDATPSYIRSSWVPRRIADENPNAKIVLTLRNPIERAFSHYWHEKRKQRFTFDFSEVLTNYDLFASWLEPGFYAEHIERFLQYFPREQILAQRFEHLSENPRDFLDELLTFSDVDTKFTPTKLYNRVNPAGDILTIPQRVKRKIGTLGENIFPNTWEKSRLSTSFSGKSEYLQGISDTLYDELLSISISEIERTENLLNIDLSNWKQKHAKKQ